MNSTTLDIRTRSSFFRLAASLTKLGICAGFVGWMVWIAVTRWDGRPAMEQVFAVGGFPAGPPIAAELDRTEELVAVFSALPPEPVVKLPPPPDGMRWSIGAGRPVVLTDALSGDWTPDSRPNLHTVVEYILSPGVETALRKLSEIPPGGWRPNGPKGAGHSSMRLVRRTAKILVARARYHHAERDDVASALAELGSVYRLSEIVYDSGSLIGVLVAMACDPLADSELIRLSREHRLSSAEAKYAIAAVRGSTFEYRDIWQRAIDAHLGEMQWKIDTSYTDDRNGEGWLVLSHLGTATDAKWSTNRRLGAWNLLSPLFNGRKTLEGKISGLRNAYERALSLPYEKGREMITACEARTLFSVVDGPLALESISPYLTNIFEIVTRNTAKRRATIAAVALSAYRTKAGRYPDSLDVLVPKYLDEVPLDPIDRRPLRYTHDADGGYMLYSIGPNLIDDGGVRLTRDERNRGRRDGDWILTSPRSESRAEPVLERIEQ